jgi:glutamyl-tRNA synthetase
MTPIVRFAPSPTGFLHAGNLRTVIVNWLFVQKTGGKFVLRIDDTDVARSKEEYVTGIRADLAWLGVRIDREERQSARMARYEAVMAELGAAGRVYPCYETSEELELKRKVQLSRSLPPVYDRASLKLSSGDISKFTGEGRTPHWRFKLETTARTIFDDLIQGHVSMDPASMSDPVVRRADGSFLYMLPSVIDDIDMDITHVVRGQDHLTNSMVQTQMFQALGAPLPTFAHLALLSTKGGELSKRLGSAGVRHYKEIGVETLSLMAYLGRLGTSDGGSIVENEQALVDGFDWSKFNKANAMFDEAELVTLNTKIIHHLPHDVVKHRLPESMTQAAWLTLRGNVTRIDDMATEWQVVTGPVTPVIEDAAFVAQARSVLEALPWNDDIWKRWTDTLKEKTGRKGKELFMPLRLALTGQPHGADMSQLMLLIGREQAMERLGI